MEAWLQWLRGPVFWAALTFMVLGLIRHVFLNLWETYRVLGRAGDRTLPTKAIVLATLKWMFPVKQLRTRLFFSLTSLLFHVSIILVPLFLAGHIALWKRAVGLSWPALPNGLATVLTVLVLVSAVLLVMERAGSRDTRALSRVSDYALPLLVALPFATGFLVANPGWSPLSYQVAMLAHVASGDLLLFLIPVTKLSHMALLPTAQLVSELAWHFPPDAGAKVGVALGKASEPI